MLLDHAHREEEQGPLTIEGINLGPRELLKLVDSRPGRGVRIALPPDLDPPPQSQ